ncbi:DnaJ domain-containing protein [Corallococcus exiguus]|uniref:J domain-containing protein n=1 Tax=Corallococcus exiguus TaxID=83462 RepID=UPI0014757019|nr:DnaJ domain-containing protein [Corallococcus exiguus]NNB95555.1 DnaJ domain-containing protein [Corallococcus exiguus]
MAEGEVRQYWVRNDRGTTWGPLTGATIELLIDSGSIQGKIQVSSDGLQFAFPWRFPEVRDAFPRELWGDGAPASLLQSTPAAIAPPPPGPAAPVAGPATVPMAGPGIAPVAGPGTRPPMAGPGAMRPGPGAVRPPVDAAGRPVAAARPPGPPVAAARPAGAPGAGAAPATAPQPPQSPADDGTNTVPPQGQLQQCSPLQLYGRIAAGEQTGLLTLGLSDRTLSVHFRKGSPEYVDSSHAEDALGVSLMGARLLTAEQLQQAEGSKERFGGDLLAALFGLGLLQPATAFTQLSQRALGILGKALRAESGTFTFEARDLPAQKAMPLGNRWALISDQVRRIPTADLKRRLAFVLPMPIMKSGGRVASSELRLTPHEVRALSFIDGVRSLGQLLQDVPQDTDHLLRVAFLLKELNGVSFAAASRAQTAASGPTAGPGNPTRPSGTVPTVGAGNPTRPSGTVPTVGAGNPTRPSGTVPTVGPGAPGPGAVPGAPAAANAGARPGAPVAGPGVAGAGPPVASPGAAPGAPAAANTGARPGAPVAGPGATPVAGPGAPVAGPGAAPRPAGAAPVAGPGAARPAAAPTAGPGAAPRPPPGAPAGAAPAAGPGARPPGAPAGAAPMAGPGAARPAPPVVAAPAAPAASGPAPGSDELPALRQLAATLKGQNHFQRLGLTEQTEGSAVKIAYFRLAKLYHPDTLPQGAPQELEKLKAEVFAYIGDAYRALSDDKSRAAYIEELKSGGGDGVDIQAILQAEELFQKACILVKARKYPEAVKMLNEAISLNADEPEFFAWRGYARFLVAPDKKAAQPEAFREIQAAIKRNERCAPAHYFLGVIAKLCGDAASALKHFKRTVELQPDHIDAMREVRMASQKK